MLAYSSCFWKASQQKRHLNISNFKTREIMGQDNKSLLNNLRGILRRVWSITQYRFLFISLTIFILLIIMYNSSDLDPLSIFKTDVNSMDDNETISNGVKNQYHTEEYITKDRIACLIIADPKYSENKDLTKYTEIMDRIFIILGIYDKYISPYCSIKVFLVNSWSSDAVNDLISNKIATLTNSQVSFIENTNLQHWRRRRFFTHQIIQKTYTNYLNQYEWYLKFDNVDKLIFPDHFANLVYHKHKDENIHKFDMDIPWILGHFIEFEPCVHFIYSLTAYAVNNKFMEIVGEIAFRKDVVNNQDKIVNDLSECNTIKCDHHHESDFPWACLEDLDIKIAPIRDENDRDYFFPFQVRDHFIRMTEYREDDWYWLGKSKGNVGNNCCAKYSIAFGNYPEDADLLLKYYQVMYSVKPYERTMELMSRVRKMNPNKIFNITQKGSSYYP